MSPAFGRPGQWSSSPGPTWTTRSIPERSHRVRDVHHERKSSSKEVTRPRGAASNAANASHRDRNALAITVTPANPLGSMLRSETQPRAKLAPTVCTASNPRVSRCSRSEQSRSTLAPIARSRGIEPPTAKRLSPRQFARNQSGSASRADILCRLPKVSSAVLPSMNAEPNAVAETRPRRSTARRPVFPRRKWAPHVSTDSSPIVSSSRKDVQKAANPSPILRTLRSGRRSSGPSWEQPRRKPSPTSVTFASPQRSRVVSDPQWARNDSTAVTWLRPAVSKWRRAWHPAKANGPIARSPGARCNFWHF
mmetsp:Transcript_42355/g.130722  ORF Transcript_42355/g.130722 Transcript_42355/m.130722 type:complete len:308 (+) Transcript_42355:422-1345(+)